MPPTLQLPAQRRLPIRVEFDVPLMAIATARDILNLECDHILELIADGKIAWAWNIANGSRLKEVRILSKSVRGFHTTNSSCGLRETPEDLIQGWILAREKKPWITGMRLKHLLACENDLVINLLNAGELSVLPGTTWRPGRGGSPSISRESVINFFKKRRLP